MPNPLIYALKQCSKIVDASELLYDSNLVDVEETDRDSIQNFIYVKFEYLSQGHIVIGYLVSPKIDKKSPCIIYNRSGSGERSLIKENALYSHKYTKFAKWGYVTIMTQYSGNGGSAGVDEFGGSEIEDVLVLKDILESLPFCDTQRIGMYGASRGGTMTYIALSKVSWIRTAVIKSGMANKFRSLTLRPEMVERSALFFDVHDKQELIRRSAIYWVDKLAKNTPILLIHGTEDEAVSVEDTQEMDTLLSRYGIPHKTLLIQGGDHRLLAHKDTIDQVTHEWFKQYLENT